MFDKLPRLARGMTWLDWALFAIGALSVPLILGLRLAGREDWAQLVFLIGLSAAVWAAVRALVDGIRRVRMWLWAMTPPPPESPDN